MTDDPTWKSYERGLLERLRYDFSPHGFRIEGTVNGRQHKVVGLHSGVPRQLDAAVYKEKATRPFFIADAKSHANPLDVGDVDAFVGLMKDVGASLGLLAAPKGPSEGARRWAEASDVTVRVMSLDDALTFRWLPLAREIYRWDWTFHPEIALAVRMLVESSDPSRFESVLESVFFEEWDAFFEYAMAEHPTECVAALEWVARRHTDDGWVFNAARILLKHDALSTKLRKELAISQDRELRDLLNAG